MSDEFGAPRNSERKDPEGERERDRIEREARERDQREGERERDRIEREARERDQRAEQLRAEERRERERFRERERQRDDERERERARLARIERERELYEPRSYQQRRPVLIKEDLGRLVYASSRAGTDVFVGMAQVFGNLISSMKDRFLPGAYRREYRDYDEDDYYGRGRSRSRYSRGRDAADNVRSAVRETADVVARSGENFSRYYDRGTYDEREERERPSPRREAERTQQERDRSEPSKPT